MKGEWLALFFSPEDPGARLTFEGDRDGDELLNGRIMARGAEAGRVVDDVAVFEGVGDPWPAEAVERVRREHWVQNNWHNGTDLGNESPVDRRMYDELAAADGPILEVAAGPGGGSLPHLLKRGPAAAFLVNDRAPEILTEWRGFLAGAGRFPNVSFCAFDGRQMPLRDGSVPAVSSILGFGSISEGDGAVREAFRVLRPGGCLFSWNSVVDPGDWSLLPEEYRADWEGTLPGLTDGETRMLEEAGFHIEWRERVPGRALVPDEGGLPKTAAEHGVTLHVEYESIRARKP